MKRILAIIKKDLKRFFTDRRMLVGLFLPGIILFVMYSFMGQIITENLMPGAEQEYVVYTHNAPEELQSLLSNDTFSATLMENNGLTDEEIYTKLKNGDAHVYIKFSENFYADVITPTGNMPQVEIFFNSADVNSTTVYSYYTSVLDTFEDSISNRFDVNAGNAVYDVATVEDTSTMIITMIMPLLLMMLLFSSCMMITTESIAGEKERGTIATLLVTPIKRTHLAFAKVISLSIPALASAVCSFFGVLLSLPKLMGGMNVSLDIYGADTYLALFTTIIITVLMFTILLLILSTFAKSVKEATSYCSVGMILVMACSLTGMFGGALDSPIVYLIPILNCSQSLSAILSLAFNPFNFILTAISSAVYIAIGIFALTKMFGNEKIMFNK